MKIYSGLRAINLILMVGLAITACSQPAQKSTVPANPLPHQHVLKLYESGLLPNARILIESPVAQQVLTGAEASVPKVADSSAPDSHVSVAKTEKNTAGDALTFSWKNSWRAGLSFEVKDGINLNDYIAEGVVEFDLNVIDLKNGGLAFKVKCGTDCERQVPFLLSARELVGKGWQSVAVPLKCFVHEGDNFSAVTTPFALETGGTGQVALANVKLQKSGRGSVECPDYKTLSVTPSMLNEWWSVSWWLPRHEQKLQEVKDLLAAKKQAEVIFIGDSITQGWERDGFNVWNRNYKKYNAVALGFGGDRTENVLWRLLHGEVEGLQPKVTVLMIGTNNTGHRHENPATTAAGIKRDIDELQQRLPGTKILLLAIFPRDETPDGDLRKINQDVNALISQFADNKTVFFLDINHAFLDARGILSKDIMPDLLHPNERGYEIWANAMKPTLTKLLNLN